MATHQTSKSTPDVVMLTGGTGPVGARQVAAVPGAEVACLALDLPQGLRGQHREDVARRQLRDSFGLSPDDVQIRPLHHARNTDRWTRLLVTDQGLVAGWRDGPAGSAMAVLPDYLTLPSADGVWTVGPGAAGLAVRMGPFDGFGAAAALTPTMLSQALQETDRKPHTILRVGPALPDIDAFAKEHGLTLETDPDTVGAKVFAAGEMGFDLRRDPQLARARLAKSVLPWRWPMMLGLVAAGIWAAAQVVVTDRIKAETRDLREQTQALVQENFVPDAPILDVRVQVSQAIAAAQADAQGWGARTNPLTQFAQAAEVLFAARARVDAASFSVAEGFQVVVGMNDFASIEALVASLEADGLTVDMEEMRASDAETGAGATLRLTTKENTP
ncbi:MAG: type II secretion system protein GspL [Pseudomonadota bacterium]